MIRYKDWTEKKSHSQCPKKNFENPSESLEEMMGGL